MGPNLSYGGWACHFGYSIGIEFFSGLQCFSQRPVHPSFARVKLKKHGWYLHARVGKMPGHPCTIIPVKRNCRRQIYVNGRSAAICFGRHLRLGPEMMWAKCGSVACFWLADLSMNLTPKQLKRCCVLRSHWLERWPRSLPLSKMSEENGSSGQQSSNPPKKRKISKITDFWVSKYDIWYICEHVEIYLANAVNDDLSDMWVNARDRIWVTFHVRSRHDDFWRKQNKVLLNAAMRERA